MKYICSSAIISYHPHKLTTNPYLAYVFAEFKVLQCSAAAAVGAGYLHQKYIHIIYYNEVPSVPTTKFKVPPPIVFPQSAAALVIPASQVPGPTNCIVAAANKAINGEPPWASVAFIPTTLDKAAINGSRVSSN
jgi:hypothetical protein